MDKKMAFKISGVEKRRLKVRYIVVVWIALPLLCLGILTFDQIQNENWTTTLTMGAVFLGLIVFMGILFYWMGKRIGKQELTVTDDALEWSNQTKLQRHLSTDIVSVAIKYNKTGEVAQVLIGTNNGNLILERFESMPELQSSVLALVPHIEPIMIKEEKSAPKSIKTVLTIGGLFAFVYVSLAAGKRFGLSDAGSELLTRSSFVTALGLYLFIVRPTGKRLGPTFGRFEPWVGAIMAIGGAVQLIRVFSG